MGSQKEGPGGCALFVLYPVEIVAVAVVAVALVAVVAAAAAAETSIDPKGTRFAEVEHLEHWQMTAHGKTIELTSCRWKEIW